MAEMALLEREIEKRTGNTQSNAPAPVSEAELQHQRLMSENMRNLLNPQEDTRFDRYTPPANPNVKIYDFESEQLRSTHTPAYQSGYARNEYHAPVVPTAPGAPSAAQRIADYVPVTVGMQSVQRFSEMSAQRVYDYAPVAPAPAREEQRGGLFETLLYQNGELIDTASPEAPAREYIGRPAYAPAYQPQQAPAYEEEDDALPTRRTLETVRHAEETANENKTTFLSALSLRTKLVLAAVAAIVVVLLAIVCVNTAIINSLDADLANAQAELTQIEQRYEDVQARYEEVTSDEYVDNWAREQGYTRPEA